MKNPILILLVVLMSIVVSSTQTTALTVDDQPCVELVPTADVDAVVISTDLSLSPVSLLSVKTAYEDYSCSLIPGSDEFKTCLPHPPDEAYKYPIRDLELPLTNNASIGAVLLTLDSEVISGESYNGIVGFIWNNRLVILGFLLGLSELLALIPGISQNGIFQAVFQALKKFKSKQTSASKI